MRGLSQTEAATQLNSNFCFGAHQADHGSGLCEAEASALWMAHVRERSSASISWWLGGKQASDPWCRTGCNNSGGPFLVDTQKRSDAHPCLKTKEKAEKN